MYATELFYQWNLSLKQQISWSINVNMRTSFLSYLFKEGLALRRLKEKENPYYQPNHPRRTNNTDTTMLSCFRFLVQQPTLACWQHGHHTVIITAIFSKTICCTLFLFLIESISFSCRGSSKLIIYCYHRHWPVYFQIHAWSLTLPGRRQCWSFIATVIWDLSRDLVAQNCLVHLIGSCYATSLLGC